MKIQIQSRELFDATNKKGQIFIEKAEYSVNKNIS